jgi:hypothetical protein
MALTEGKCLKCGYCCKQGVCPYGEWNKRKGQCKFLRGSKPGEYTCGKYDEIKDDKKAMAWWSPAFGAGCSSGLNTDRQRLARSLKESKKAKSAFTVMKDNEIPLTPEERAEVMRRKAVWHHGPHGEETSAVWKGEDSSGNLWYVTNTHRAYNKRPTLAGAISRYHKFIKGTA